MVTEANRGRYRHYRLAAGLYSGLSRFRPQSLDYGRRSFASCLMESTCKLSRTEGGNARKPLDRQVLRQVRLRKLECSAARSDSGSSESISEYWDWRRNGTTRFRATARADSVP